MKRTIKIIISFLLVAQTGWFFTSCLEPEDLMTSEAKSGGLLDATGSIPYKLGATPTFNVNLDIPQGPAITSIKVYKTFTHNADTSESETVLLSTISIDGANTAADLSKTLSLTWAELIASMPTLPKGYVIPTDEMLADIGDAFTLSYVSVMDDGREVAINSKTTVSIANFFAGSYAVELWYFHPTAGGTYPTDPYGGIRALSKDLIAVSATTCKTAFAVWGTAGETMYITINADNSVSFTVENWGYDVSIGDPNDATKISHYDPATGTIYVYYKYMGSGGFRIFWEFFELE